MKNEDKIVDLLVDMLAENKLTNTKLTHLTGRVDHLAGRVDHLTERVDHLTERVDIISDKVDVLTSKFDHLTDRVVSLEQKFDKQSETLVETLAEQIAMRNQLSQLNDRVGEALDTFYRAVDNKEEVNARFKEIEHRLDSLERKDKTA